MTILNEYEQDLIDSGVINKVIVQGNLVDDPLYGDILILYTEKGQKDALLLIKYLENKIARIEKLKRKLVKPENHYLLGILLGYDKRDIKDFYYSVLKLSSESFKSDKKAAKKFFAEYK